MKDPEDKNPILIMVNRHPFSSLPARRWYSHSKGQISFFERMVGLEVNPKGKQIEISPVYRASVSLRWDKGFLLLQLYLNDTHGISLLFFNRIPFLKARIIKSDDMQIRA